MNDIIDERIEAYHHDGVLENWFLGAGIVHGKIYNDRKKRFLDGRSIHTSKILEASDTQLKEGSIIETLHSVYLLGKPFKAKVGGGDTNDTNILSKDNQDN